MANTTAMARTLRGVQRRAFDATCDVLRKTTTSDAAGGRVVTWNTHTEGVACSVQPRTDRALELVVADRVSSQVSHVVRLPPGTDVTSADRIVVGDRTFEVDGVAHASYDVVLVALCTEVS